VKSRVERYLTDLDSFAELILPEIGEGQRSHRFFLCVNCTVAAESGLSEGIVNPDQGY
jgi:hypothetical protein